MTFTLFSGSSHVLFNYFVICSLYAENTGVGDDEHQEVQKGKKSASLIN